MWNNWLNEDIGKQIVSRGSICLILVICSPDINGHFHSFLIFMFLHNVTVDNDVNTKLE